jgi:hypothetical protein
MGWLKDIVDSVVTVRREWRSGSQDRAQRERLKSMLEDERFAWRSLEQLSAAIAANEDTTRALLVELGARPQANDTSMWGLVSRNGPPSA